MGGAIATLYVAAHPDHVAALALTSAMFLPQTKPYSEPIAEAILIALKVAGRATHYTLGHGPYMAAPSADSTQSAARFAAYTNLVASMPQLALGGPSNQWVYEALSASKEIRNSTSSRMRTPLYMINAAVDKTVVTAANVEFCKKVPGCKTLTLNHSSHEILLEKDGVRNVALEAILDFFRAHR